MVAIWKSTDEVLHDGRKREVTTTSSTCPSPLGGRRCLIDSSFVDWRQGSTSGYRRRTGFALRHQLRQGTNRSDDNGR